MRHGTRWGRSLQLVAVALAPAALAAGSIANLQPFPNPTGTARTLLPGPTLDTNGPFFQSLGSNGRACVHCHDPGEGWSISPPGIRARFEQSRGLHPLFRTVDGANAPEAPVSTLAQRRGSYSLLLSKGLIRTFLPVPPRAEFRVAAVDDPYQHASARELSLYRRPLPTTNLAFTPSLMWDGRETPIAADRPYLAPTDDHFRHQAQSAIRVHFQGKVVSDQQLQAIVAVERGLTTAQAADNGAGALDTAGGRGGPRVLAGEPYYVGINDPLQPDPRTHQTGNGRAFNLFSSWFNSPPTRGGKARQQIARGEAVFNSHQFTISGVPGFNDAAGQDAFVGTCSTCHNAPNSGGHSLRRPMKVGESDAFFRSPDLPLYTLERIDPAGRPTGDSLAVTDPGRAMITGRWDDIGKFKVPALRGLAARAPYFHNGFAADLRLVLEFYSRRFAINFDADERDALVAFLQSL